MNRWWEIKGVVLQSFTIKVMGSTEKQAESLATQLIKDEDERVDFPYVHRVDITSTREVGRDEMGTEE